MEQLQEHLVGVDLCPLVLLTRLDEAAVALQKEKNMYKEIENFAMCFKVSSCGFFPHLQMNLFTIRISYYSSYITVSLSRLLIYFNSCDSSVALSA